MASVDRGGPRWRRWFLVAAASTAIAFEVSALVPYLSTVCGVRTRLGQLESSIGTVAAFNMAGTQQFIEVLLRLTRGGGDVSDAVELPAFGASTADVQTLRIGRITFAIIRNGGELRPGTRA